MYSRRTSKYSSGFLVFYPYTVVVNDQITGRASIRGSWTCKKRIYQGAKSYLPVDNARDGGQSYKTSTFHTHSPAMYDVAKSTLDPTDRRSSQPWSQTPGNFP